MHLATNDIDVWFWGAKADMEYLPYTRHCIEMVSDEMYVALMELANYKEHVSSISFLLYKIIEQKWLSRN